MNLTTINFQPQLDKLRSQISELVQQYADIAYAPTPFVPGQSAVPVSGKVIGAKELELVFQSKKLKKGVRVEHLCVPSGT